MGVCIISLKVTMFKVISIIVAIFVGFWLLGMVFGIISLPFHAASNTVQMGHDVIDKTLNADNAIYNYEWFKQQKQDIETSKTQYQNAIQSYDSFVKDAGDRGKWTFEDKQESARLRSIVLGLQNQITERVNDYNARASMANRDIFRDGVLPSTLEFSASLLQ